nr:hypothetical protein BaRGS_028206 [Batillaria attramentaria]
MTTWMPCYTARQLWQVAHNYSVALALPWVDIGNIGQKVSSMTIDPGKKTAIKRKSSINNPPSRAKNINKESSGGSHSMHNATFSSSNTIHNNGLERHLHQYKSHRIEARNLLRLEAMDISDDKGAYSHGLMPVEDIDANDRDNPQLVSEYVNEIYDYMRHLEVDATKHTLAKYLMELTIMEYDMVHYPPSHIAAAALYLAIKLLDNSAWTETLVYYSTYSEEQLQPVAAKMASLVVKAETSKLTAIRTKYSTSKLMKISQIPELKSSLVTDLAAHAT